MRAPDAVGHAGPITADELSEIFASILKRKGDQPPASAELDALATALNGMRFSIEHDQEIEALDLFTQQRLALRPYKPPFSQAILHLRDFPKNWHDLAPNMVAEFCGAMKPTNAGRPFGSRLLARLLERVIPRITNEEPSAATIRQWLMKPDQRKRQKPRARIRK